MFNATAFRRLAEIEADPAITIYLPTHRAGQQTHNGHDRIAFKDAVKDVAQALEARGQHKPREIEQLLQPLRDLDDDGNFWRHQSDTLAVFLAAGTFETFALPIATARPITHVGTQFHLTPAAAMLRPEARYYVFALALGQNAFFEATRHTITSVFIADEVPAKLEESLAPYDGSESLQWHSAGPTGTGAIFHGQGSNEDRQDEREEIYFTDVSRGIDKLLAGQQEPLVLLCDAQYDKALRAAIKYPHLYPEGVHVDPGTLGMADVHAETWRVVAPHFDKSAAELGQRVSDAVAQGRLAATLYDAVPAARSGQVATLLVAQGLNPVYGAFDSATNAVQFHDTRQDSSVDLVEDAIRHTVANGGQVVVRERERLPADVEGAAAVLRYAS